MKTVFAKASLSFLLLLVSYYSNAQGNINWSKPEDVYYRTIKDLCEYLHQHANLQKNRDYITDKWVLFDYILNDTSLSRKQKRIKKLDVLLASFKNFIDSAGLENIDAKPLRYYKDSPEIYGLFSGPLSDHINQIFVYFNKKTPTIPIGYLLFDEITGKLISWILIKEGGECYFLTFNIM